MRDADYLSPDERDKVLFHTTSECMESHRAMRKSHAVVDELLAEARIELVCEHGRDCPAWLLTGDEWCNCDSCTLARRIDDVTGGDDE